MKKIQEIIVSCLVMATLYTPLIWYMRELHSHTAGNTDFLDLELLEQIVIVVLLTVPAWCLSCIKIKFKPDEPMS